MSSSHIGVPESWCITTLNDVYQVFGGGTPTTSKPEYWGGDTPWITSADIEGVRTINVRKYVTEKGIENSTTTKAPKNSLLVVTRVGLGKIAIIKKETCFSQDLQALVMSDDLLAPEYTLYLLSFKLQFLKYEGRGTTISGLTKKQLKDLEYPLPPFNEQHRIVAKIEELFSELDKGIESLKAAREQLKVYRQALLKHAFEGKLTEQWRAEQGRSSAARGQESEAAKDNADAAQGSASVAGGQEPGATKLETADQLLERIKQEREARYQQQLEDWKAAVKQWEADGKDGKKPVKPKAAKKLERPSPAESKGYEIIPGTWCLAKIGDVSSVGTGVTPLKSRSDYYENGHVAWVTSGALNESFVSEASGCVTDLALKETNLRLYPTHTLLMAMYGEGKTRGKCSELLISATTNQAIAAMVQCGIEEETRSYLKWFLMKNYSDIRRKSSGGVQPNLNLGIVENTVFPLCSIAEMEAIVNELESKLSVIEDTESTITDQLLKSEALRQSILKKAFSGQLVPQDPNDEPASALLDRIAKEKEEAAAKAQKAKAAKKKPKTTRKATRKAS